MAHCGSRREHQLRIELSRISLYTDFPTHNPGTPTGLTADTYAATHGGYASRSARTMGLAALRRCSIKSLPHLWRHCLRPNRHGDRRMHSGSIPVVQTGTLNRSASIQENSVATVETQTQTLGNLVNGNEASLRLDYNWNANNRFFVNYNYTRTDGLVWTLSNLVMHPGFRQSIPRFVPAGLLELCTHV